MEILVGDGLNSYNLKDCIRNQMTVSHISKEDTSLFLSTPALLYYTTGTSCLEGLYGFEGKITMYEFLHCHFHVFSTSHVVVTDIDEFDIDSNQFVFMITCLYAWKFKSKNCSLSELESKINLSDIVNYHKIVRDFRLGRDFATEQTVLPPFCTLQNLKLGRILLFEERMKIFLETSKYEVCEGSLNNLYIKKECLRDGIKGTWYPISLTESFMKKVQKYKSKVLNPSNISTTIQDNVHNTFMFIVFLNVYIAQYLQKSPFALIIIYDTPYM